MQMTAVGSANRPRSSQQGAAVARHMHPASSFSPAHFRQTEEKKVPRKSVTESVNSQLYDGRGRGDKAKQKNTRTLSPT